MNNVTNYYYGGTYYEKTSSGYKVVAPPIGAVVENLPEGGEEVKIGATYCQPVNVDVKSNMMLFKFKRGKSSY